MRNFEMLHEGIDPNPLLDYLDLHPELWKMITFRQEFEGSPHKDTETIVLRGPIGVDYDAINSTNCVDYQFPGDGEVFQLMADLLGPVAFDKLQCSELGRVMIVKLKPGGVIAPHVDTGAYADYYTRYHIVVQTNGDASLCADGETQFMPTGTAWLFNHKSMHYGSNMGKTDRIHVIFDAVTPLHQVCVSDEEGSKVGDMKKVSYA
jgi:hypothetical protein